MSIPLVSRRIVMNLEITGNLQKRFVQDAVLLHKLDPVRGSPTAYGLDRHPRDAGVPREELLKRKFLDSFALLASTHKDGDTVSAAALEVGAPEGSVIRIASNAGVSASTLVLLREVMEILHDVSAMGLTNERRLSVLLKMISLDKAKIWYYLADLRKQRSEILRLEQFLPKLSSTFEVNEVERPLSPAESVDTSDAPFPPDPSPEPPLEPSEDDYSDDHAGVSLEIDKETPPTESEGKRPGETIISPSRASRGEYSTPEFVFNIRRTGDPQRRELVVLKDILDTSQKPSWRKLIEILSNDEHFGVGFVEREEFLMVNDKSTYPLPGTPLFLAPTKTRKSTTTQCPPPTSFYHNIFNSRPNGLIFCTCLLLYIMPQYTEDQLRQALE
ncbi:hypothetical protein CTAM01_14204, partial [Colletotrichum tamarilloi]